MPSLTDLIYVAFPFVLGILGWSLYKIYEHVIEKIDLTKELNSVSLQMALIKTDMEHIKIEMVGLSENVDSSLSTIDNKIANLHSQFIVTDHKISNSIKLSESHEKTLENYGKVIHAIVKKVK